MHHLYLLRAGLLHLRLLHAGLLHLSWGLHAILGLRVQVSGW